MKPAETYRPPAREPLLVRLFSAVPDYKHGLLFGISVPPSARDHQAAQDAVAHLSDALLAHLKYEEEQLLEPIGRLAIQV